ncbi:unnamed protein product [Closterium sp. NIES-64]|nr:unnamed protein product [Closterium sp. NIES-64]
MSAYNRGNEKADGDGLPRVRMLSCLHALFTQLHDSGSEEAAADGGAVSRPILDPADLDGLEKAVRILHLRYRSCLRPLTRGKLPSRTELKEMRLSAQAMGVRAAMMMIDKVPKGDPRRVPLFAFRTFALRAELDSQALRSTPEPAAAATAEPAAATAEPANKSAPATANGCHPPSSSPSPSPSRWDVDSYRIAAAPLEDLLEDLTDEVQAVWEASQRTVYDVAVSLAPVLAQYALLGRAVQLVIQENNQVVTAEGGSGGAGGSGAGVAVRKHTRVVPAVGDELILWDDGLDDVRDLFLPDRREANLNSSPSPSSSPSSSSASSAAACSFSSSFPLGATVRIDSMSDFSWFVAWNGTSPVDSIPSEVSVKRLLHSIGAPSSQHAMLRSSDKSLLMAVTLPEVRFEAERRVGEQLAWAVEGGARLEMKQGRGQFVGSGGSVGGSGGAGGLAGGGGGGGGGDGGGGGVVLELPGRMPIIGGIGKGPGAGGAAGGGGGGGAGAAGAGAGAGAGGAAGAAAAAAGRAGMGGAGGRGAKHQALLRRSFAKRLESVPDGTDLEELEPAKAIPYEEVERATQGWAEEAKLGEGGSAVVYRGCGADGQLWAVKRGKKGGISRRKDYEKEVRQMWFQPTRNDTFSPPSAAPPFPVPLPSLSVLSPPRPLLPSSPHLSPIPPNIHAVSQLRHANLVRLLGFCEEREGGAALLPPARLHSTSPPPLCPLAFALCPFNLPLFPPQKIHAVSQLRHASPGRGGYRGSEAGQPATFTPTPPPLMTSHCPPTVLPLPSPSPSPRHPLPVTLIPVTLSPSPSPRHPLPVTLSPSPFPVTLSPSPSPVTLSPSPSPRHLSSPSPSPRHPSPVTLSRHPLPRHPLPVTLSPSPSPRHPLPRHPLPVTLSPSPSPRPNPPPRHPSPPSPSPRHPLPVTLSPSPHLPVTPPRHPLPVTLSPSPSPRHPLPSPLPVTLSPVTLLPVTLSPSTLSPSPHPVTLSPSPLSPFNPLPVTLSPSPSPRHPLPSPSPRHPPRHPLPVTLSPSPSSPSPSPRHPLPVTLSPSPSRHPLPVTLSPSPSPRHPLPVTLSPSPPRHPLPSPSPVTLPRHLSPSPSPRHPLPVTLSPSPSPRHPLPVTSPPSPSPRHPLPVTLSPSPSPRHPLPVTLSPSPSSPSPSPRHPPPRHPLPVTLSPSPSPRHPPPVTLSPSPSPRHPLPVTLSPSPSPRHPLPVTLSPSPSPRHPLPVTLSPSPSPRHPLPVTLSPSPSPRHPLPVTLSPSPSPRHPLPVTLSPSPSPRHPLPVTLSPSPSPRHPLPVTLSPSPSPRHPLPVTLSPSPSPRHPLPVTLSPSPSPRHPLPVTLSPSPPPLPSSFPPQIHAVSQLRHPNLVRLLGYCEEREELLLVYEFVPNGNLRQHINPIRGEAAIEGKPGGMLSFDKRLEVALGVAEALQYMHGCHPAIIHRDVKTLNVFLDNDLHMALGVAEALQYMHGCHPAIIHCDVKTLNVFLDNDLHPKLGDFGNVKEINDESTSPRTPEWSALQAIWIIVGSSKDTLVFLSPSLPSPLPQPKLGNFDNVKEISNESTFPSSSPLYGISLVFPAHTTASFTPLPPVPASLASQLSQPKLGDFGNVKEINDESTSPTHTRVVGTPGYLDPQYCQTSIVSDRSDVYSFGVVLLELITGKAPVLKESDDAGERMALAKWATPAICSGHTDSVADPVLLESSTPQALQAVGSLAAMCVQRLPKDRPAMGEVVRRLKSIRQQALAAAATASGSLRGFPTFSRAGSGSSHAQPQPVQATASRSGEMRIGGRGGSGRGGAQQQKQQQQQHEKEQLKAPLSPRTHTRSGSITSPDAAAAAAAADGGGGASTPRPSSAAAAFPMLSPRIPGGINVFQKDFWRPKFPPVRSKSDMNLANLPSESGSEGSQQEGSRGREGGGAEAEVPLSAVPASMSGLVRGRKGVERVESTEEGEEGELEGGFGRRWMGGDESDRESEGSGGGRFGSGGSGGGSGGGGSGGGSSAANVSSQLLSPKPAARALRGFLPHSRTVSGGEVPTTPTTPTTPGGRPRSRGEGGSGGKRGLFRRSESGQSSREQERRGKDQLNQLKQAKQQKPERRSLQQEAQHHQQSRLRYQQSQQLQQREQQQEREREREGEEDDEYGAPLSPQSREMYGQEECDIDTRRPESHQSNPHRPDPHDQGHWEDDELEDGEEEQGEHRQGYARAHGESSRDRPGDGHGHGGGHGRERGGGHGRERGRERGHAREPSQEEAQAPTKQPGKIPKSRSLDLASLMLGLPIPHSKTKEEVGGEGRGGGKSPRGGGAKSPRGGGGSKSPRGGGAKSPRGGGGAKSPLMAPSSPLPETAKKFLSATLGKKNKMKEIQALVALQHANLAEILGYALEKDDVQIAYDLPPNSASLENYLFPEGVDGDFLPLRVRVKVAISTSLPSPFPPPFPPPFSPPFPPFIITPEGVDGDLLPLRGVDGDFLLLRVRVKVAIGMTKGLAYLHSKAVGMDGDFLPLRVRVKVAIGVAKGLAYLHSKSVVHGNLMCCNVMLDSSYTALLTGYGLAAILAKGSSKKILKGAEGMGKDAFDFGVVLFSLLTGRQGAHSTAQQHGAEALFDWAEPYTDDLARSAECGSATRRMVVRMLDVLAKECMQDDPSAVKRMVKGMVKSMVKSMVVRMLDVLAKECMQDDPRCRPSMEDLVVRLFRLQDSLRVGRKHRWDF